VLVVPARPPEQPDGGEAELQAPAALEFRDENPAPGKVRGRVVLRRAADERRIDGYRLFWTNAQGQPVALAKEWPAQAQDWQWDILPDASLPAGAALLSAVSVYGSRTSAQISVRADNFPRPMPVILDTGADTLVFTKPFLTTEGNDPTLLVLAIDSSNRVTARRCARDGAFCKRTDVSRPGFGPQSAVFGATMLGTSVYVVESTTDRRMVVHKCSVDMTTCSTQDISSGDATVRLYGVELAIDVARAELHSVSVEEFTEAPVYRTVHRRCSLDGTQCTRKDLSIPIGSLAFGVDPPTGDLVVVSAGYGSRTPLVRYRCARGSAVCASSGIDVGMPAHNRCFLSGAVDARDGTLYTVVARACASAGGPAPLLVRCPLGGADCQMTELPGTGDHFGSVSVAVDAPRNRILVGAGDLSPAGIINTKVYSCEAPLGPCSSQRVGLVNNEADANVAVDSANGDIYVAARDAIDGNTPTLTRCNSAGAACFRAILADAQSKLSFANNGFATSVAFAPDGTMGLGATYLLNGVGYTCAPSNPTCQKSFVVTSEETTVSYWPERSTFVFAARTYDQANISIRPKLGIGVCAPNTAACSIEDASQGYGESGYLPRVLPDPTGQKIQVVHLGLQNGYMEPLLTTCSASVTNCFHRRLAAEAGMAEASFWGPDAKVTPGGESVLVTGVSLGRLRLLRCSLQTSSCVASDLGPAPLVRRESFSGTAVLPSATFVDVLTGSDDGIVSYRCVDGGTCTPRQLPVRRARGAGPNWLSVVRDPEHDAVYVAAFRDGTRQELFVGREENHGTLTLYRCSSDFALCHEVVSRSDIFSTGVHDGLPRSDGGPYFWGTPAALVYDAPRRRVVLGATDAADLFRPLLLQLDTY
jgi:hypothetical protein